MSMRTYTFVGVALLVPVMLTAGCTPKADDPVPPAGAVPTPPGTPAVNEPTDATEDTGTPDEEDASAVSPMMGIYDRDEDGHLTKEEMGEMWDHVARVDADGDGVLTPEEISNLNMPGTIGVDEGGMGMGGGGGMSPHGGGVPDMDKMQSGHGSDTDGESTDE